MWREDVMMWLLRTPVHCRTRSRLSVCMLVTGGEGKVSQSKADAGKTKGKS